MIFKHLVGAPLLNPLATYFLPWGFFLPQEVILLFSSIKTVQSSPRQRGWSLCRRTVATVGGASRILSIISKWLILYHEKVLQRQSFLVKTKNSYLVYTLLLKCSLFGGNWIYFLRHCINDLPNCQMLYHVPLCQQLLFMELSHSRSLEHRRI